MRCYYVLIHGKLDWNVAALSDDFSQPRGFFCHRYVLASDEGSAAEVAFGRVRANLLGEGGWLSGDSATLRLEADEIRTAPLIRLFKPDNRGHTFY